MSRAQVRRKVEQAKSLSASSDFVGLKEAFPGNQSPFSPLKFFSLAALLVVATLFSGALLRPFPEFIIPGVLVFSAICFLSSAISSNIALFLLGLSLFTAPVFGPGALEVVIAALLFPLIVSTAKDRCSSFEVLILSSLALAIIPSCLTGFLASFDGLVPLSIFEQAGFYGLYRWSLVNHAGWFEALNHLRGWTLASIYLVILCSLFRNKPDSIKVFVPGLIAGATIASLWLFFQVLGQPGIASFNRDPFFTSMGRFPATFADPNAFGIVVAFSVPVLIGCTRIFTGWARFLGSGLLVTLLVAACWSGTRTFLLGLGVWFLFALVQYRPSSRMLTVKFLLSGVLGLIAISWFLVSNKIVNSDSNPLLSRTIESLSLGKIDQFGESRRLFGRIALEASRENSLTGIGAGQFLERQPEFARLALTNSELEKLSGWQDNANNFYLQVLAESGIVGLVAWLIIFSSIWFLCRNVEADQVMKSLRVGLAVLFVCLVTGPHIHFPEVRLIAVSFMAILISRETREFSILKPLALCSSCILMALLLMNSISGLKTQNNSLRGFYGLEESGELWSSGRASIELCGLSGGDYLEFRSGHPAIEKEPVTAVFTAPGWKKELELKDHGWNKLAFDDLAPSTRLELEVSRLWSPLQSDIHGDARWLGLRVKLPEKLCNG